MSWRKAAIVASTDAVGTDRQLIGPNDATQNRTSGVGGVLINARMFAGGGRRSAQVAAGYVEQNLGDAPGFHDLLDPTTPKRSRGFEIRDWINNITPVGVCSFAYGLHELVTVNDWTTLVGLGFEHGPDFIWKTFLKDAPAGVPRVVHQVVTAALGNANHELMIVVDGFLKQIRWYIDSVLVDSYTPSIPLDQMAGAINVMPLKLRYRGLVPALGDMSIRYFGGELAAPILTLREFP